MKTNFQETPGGYVGGFYFTSVIETPASYLKLVPQALTHFFPTNLQWNLFELVTHINFHLPLKVNTFSHDSPMAEHRILRLFLVWDRFDVLSLEYTDV